MKLAIFDMDGTLIDSQVLIVGAMAAAFEQMGLTVPSRDAVLSIVGLSLPQAMTRLAPVEVDAAGIVALTDAYRAEFVAQRAATGGEASVPLYPGALAALQGLADAGWQLGVATGKARRGVDHVFAAHDIGRFFTTIQTADGHPSKPHPSMVHTALAESGVAADAAVMIGDTTFDIEMGRAAGVRSIGVSWGYHPDEDLRTAGASDILTHFDQLVPLLT
ncbi:phosphoglycolate phosphatase [Monaibacterium marinum]|uniref:Phosphoglycolate phosphatase n=1 Tax=Pontivivens marinum TaxID=1690039 RepID=A0A2C9CSW4_9RHOB|nr:HAD-IA family hydrolase [Monaibacterium marinum]SOH94601.1 phosphoglycolate phosphatase [Monaibacterium marinum]